jgi:adenylate cyclase
MSPSEFSELLGRFYQGAARAVDEAKGVVDKFMGDGILALFIPGVGGPDHASQAIQAGTNILRVTGNRPGQEPWLPVGAGLHTGTAFVGSLGSAGTVDFTAVGDTVNTAARLGSLADAGELLVSTHAARQARVDCTSLEQRHLNLRGRSQPMDVCVLIPD